MTMNFDPIEFFKYFNESDRNDIMVISIVEKEGFQTWEQFATSYHPFQWVERLANTEDYELAYYYSKYFLNMEERMDVKKYKAELKRYEDNDELPAKKANFNQYSDTMDEDDDGEHPRKRTYVPSC